MGFYPFQPTPPGGAAGGSLAGSYPNPTLAGGSVTSTALAQSAVGGWIPPDNVLLAASSDPALTSNSTTTTAGTLYLVKIPVRTAFTATNIWLGNIVAGLGASTGSFVGLYSSAGSLLSGSSDIGASLLTGGAVSNALTTPQALTAGTFVWVAVLVNLATTQPTLAKGIGGTSFGGFVNANLSAANYRFAANGTGLTTLPASITPASNVTSTDWWVGIS